MPLLEPSDQDSVNQGDEGYDLRDSVRVVNKHITNSFRRASDNLEKARLDIIMLCSTRREVDCLRIQSEDIHLLSIAFLQNIQNFSLPGDNGQDFLQAYRRYLAVLRGRAIHRPQRRVFLDIQNFQEELDALKSVTDTQVIVAKKLLSLLYPGSFRVTNKARMERYGAEYEFWKKVDKRLTDRLAELDRLTEQSRRLKDDVKQAIEILEEDHGKAIRVFTVVTLFFLPLSFVSSFMGMNTTDIRDTRHDQRLFWAVATPVKASVVVLALTYAYKGDDTRHWFRSWTRKQDKAEEGGGGNGGRARSSGLEQSLTGTWRPRGSRALWTKTW